MKSVIVRTIGVMLVAVLGAATLYLPATEPPTAGAEPLISLETDVTCPLTEPVGDRQDQLTIAVSEPGTVGALVFAAGEELGRDVLQKSQPGIGVIDLTAMAEVAAAPTLLTFPSGVGRGESVLWGTTSIGASGCAVPANTPISVGGASTDDGEDVILVLANPYAVDARLNVTVISENGTESNRDLESLVIPPRTSSTVNLTALFPGRLRIGAVITPEVGSVVAGLRWTGETDLAESTAAPLAEDHFFVLPASQPPGGTRLQLQSVESVEVPVRIEIITNDGEVTTREEVVPARGGLDLGVGPRETAKTVRVRASAPIGADVRMIGAGGRAIIPGTTATSGTWYIPGAGVGPQGSVPKVTVHNPSGRPAQVSIRPVGGDATNEFRVPPNGTRTRRIPPRINQGVEVTANVPVIATFSTERERAIAADGALPIIESGS